MDNADENVEAAAAAPAAVSSDILDTVLIGNNPKFYELCRDLRENPPRLQRANVCIPEEGGDNHEHLSHFVTSMGHNTTVQSLTLIIPESVRMGPEDARRLGNMMASQTSIRNLVLSNFSNKPSAFHVFWQGVARSQSLSVLAVHGLNVCDCGLAEAQRIPSLQGLIFDKCTFDPQGTVAFMGLMEQPDSPVVMIRIDCCVMGSDVKMLIAKSLASERSTLPAFSLDDTDLDIPCTDAFADAIAQNSTLRHVEFHSCSERALKVLTKAITNNINIMGGKVTNHESNSSAMALACQLQINHYTALNRAGRKYLRDDVQRPNQETIEACWYRMLCHHRQDNSMTFSLLRDYPQVFLQFLGLWEGSRDTTTTKRQIKSSSSTAGVGKRRSPDDELGVEDESIAAKRTKCDD